MLEEGRAAPVRAVRWKAQAGRQNCTARSPAPAPGLRELLASSRFVGTFTTLFILIVNSVSTVSSELLLSLLRYKAATGCRVLYHRYLMQKRCWEKEKLTVLTKYLK